MPRPIRAAVLCLALGSSTFPLAACFGGPGAESPENADDCSTAFFCYVHAKEVSDLPTATRLYDKACTMGEVHACVTLGQAYESGTIPLGYSTSAFPKDPLKAYAAFKRACDGKEHAGCLRLAELVESGSVPSDTDPAPYYERVCRAESFEVGDSCGKAAKGAAAQGDAARALELRSLGCAHGRHGCAEAGRAEIAKGDAASVAKGLDHLHDACFFEKDADACFDQAKALDAGGKDQDAYYAYEDACDKGRKDACANVEAHRAKDRSDNEARWKADRERDEAEWRAREKEAARSGASSGGGGSGTSSGGGGSSTNVSMTDATANGLRASTLTCQLEDGGLMGSFALLAALGERKGALAACGLKPGQTFQADWTMKHGAVTAAKASGTGATRTDGCATEAMKHLKIAFTGHCSATMGIDR